MSSRTESTDTTEQDGQGILKSIVMVKDMHLSNIFKNWADVSRINYFVPAQESRAVQNLRKSFLYYNGSSFIHMKYTEKIMENEVPPENFSDEKFPEHITNLMDVQNYWGCFYIFFGLYQDKFSPTVKVRKLHEVPEIADGCLTTDVVSVSLSYLHHIPILEEFTYIKLDLSSMLLRNIDVLEKFKFIVYLDISDNFLVEIKVLSKLLYLQYISVSHNRLRNVLEYDTPQWFLSEVHCKYNCIAQIRDLTDFWSLTILDLSHNNIKHITGLENLRYLRRLDLSFNHIQKIEGLDHLPLLWLDLSYNNIALYDLGPNSGLWTLLHLEYLNIEENKFTSMKIFTGCSRLTVLRARNNLFAPLLDMAVYMKQMRRLRVLDLRENPIGSVVGYKDVVINTFPSLLCLDEIELDPIEVRKLKMYMSPEVNTFAIRRLLRLLYVEQMSRAKLSPFVPPADTTEVPLIIIVGYEAVGKGALVRRLASECSEHVELAKLHTTSPFGSEQRYHKVTKEKFDEMLLAGEFLSYRETGGESYGLSREEAYVKNGKVKIACMQLIGALMLKHRGRRPSLILATYKDKNVLVHKQNERKMKRKQAFEDKLLLEERVDKSTLQVLVSGRIIMRGIINEILLNIPEGEIYDDFILPSDCSLLQDSETRQAANEYIRDLTFLTTLDASSTLTRPMSKNISRHEEEEELLLLHHIPDNSTHDNENMEDVNKIKSVEVLNSKIDVQESHLKTSKSDNYTEFVDTTSTTHQDDSKIEKSEYFTATVPTATSSRISIYDDAVIKKTPKKSISSNIPFTAKHPTTVEEDLWFNFLLDTGLLQASDYNWDPAPVEEYVESKHPEDLNYMIKNLDQYNKIDSTETFFMSIRDDYECIHRLSPGLFRNTISMEDPEEAFHKMKGIIKDIIALQKTMPPMYDIDFSNEEDYPNYQEKLQNIKENIAPYRLF